MRSSVSSLALAVVVAGCFAPNPADRLYTCASSSQCPSGYDCAEGYCFRHGHAPTMSDPCNDHQQDGDETGVDCGGPTCPVRCANGGMCAAGSDCDSGICNLVTNLCVASNCEDGMRDDAETDVDCGGGTCAKCGDGKACTTPGDCNSLLCNRTTHLCVADPCFDGTKDQSETDTDCGGLCQAKCKNNQGCNNVNDCVAGATCTVSKCQVPRCVDNMKNFDETDTDCGGATCGGCADGKACTVGSDCTSSYCNVQTHVCVPTQCQDGAKDGSESDVDCGGPDCNKCPDGKKCSGGNDCVGGSICTFDKLCCHPNGMACTGAACGTATDNCGQSFACGNNGACADSSKPYCKGNCCSPLKDQATTCAGKQCGTLSDGCGGSLLCLIERDRRSVRTHSPPFASRVGLSAYLPRLSASPIRLKAP